MVGGGGYSALPGSHVRFKSYARAYGLLMIPRTLILHGLCLTTILNLL